MTYPVPVSLKSIKVEAPNCPVVLPATNFPIVVKEKVISSFIIGNANGKIVGKMVNSPTHLSGLFLQRNGFLEPGNAELQCWIPMTIKIFCNSEQVSYQPYQYPASHSELTLGLIPAVTWATYHHILSTYKPHARHIWTTYLPHTNRLHRPHTDQTNLFITYHVCHVEIKWCIARNLVILTKHFSHFAGGEMCNHMV